jgi:hypothetical protein
MERILPIEKVEKEGGKMERILPKIDTSIAKLYSYP